MPSIGNLRITSIMDLVYGLLFGLSLTQLAQAAPVNNDIVVARDALPEAKAQPWKDIISTLPEGPVVVARTPEDEEALRVREHSLAGSTI